MERTAASVLKKSNVVQVNCLAPIKMISPVKYYNISESNPKLSRFE